ncbi:hypothetical protein OEZ85_002065 [Tetradesmus obliquus]|uniref:Uncharacterized protein n=1 Tax=Tetradesmus obliquus TaxID=3088 RepID=A0ABY8U4N4_TETOB|nr:hypothetical protein OEZ85_002065 [Tetradesmus obliquus]
MSNHNLYALVTGGNRGIGLEVCKQLVERKKPVILTCRNLEAGKAAAAELSKNGTDVRVLSLDTGSAASINELAQHIKSEYDQKIDLLVNNAGILVRAAWDKPTYDTTLAVNTAGPVLLSQSLLPLLAPGALIINVSSGLGKLANLSPDYVEAVAAMSSIDAFKEPAAAVPFNADSSMGSAAPGAGGMCPTYCVAKALLNKAGQLLAADDVFKQRGVSVVAVCPGWCRTDMGGEGADRSGAEGAASVLAPWLKWDSSMNGGFSRDGEPQEW